MTQTETYEVRWLPKDCARTGGGFVADEPRAVTRQDHGHTLLSARLRAEQLRGSCCAIMVGVYSEQTGAYIEAPG